MSILPALARAGGVLRRSTSSGLRRADTGERIPASGGTHWYLLVADGADIERFLRVLHARCWLHGFGWLVVSASGQLLERSLIDRTVFAPERRVFEGHPVVELPLAQDQASRCPTVIPGEALDTRSACPDLSQAEAAKFRDLRNAAAHRLGREAAEAKAEFIARQAAEIAERLGVSRPTARRIVEKQCAGVLLAGLLLPFDSAEFEGATVADVLADPERFMGATLADPLEGPAYGRGKAKVLRRSDCSLCVHSFAHGRTVYTLKHDLTSIEAAIRKAAPQDAAGVFVNLLLEGDIAADEEQRLRDLTAEISGVKLRPLNAKIKAARVQQAEQQAAAEKERRSAERTDARLRIPAPAPDGERLPVLQTLDEVLGSVAADEPPVRDLAGHPVEIRCRQPLLLHELTGSGSNAEEEADTRLPAPALPLLTGHDKFSLEHLIERHIEFVAVSEQEGERSVALPQVFVDHYAAY